MSHQIGIFDALIGETAIGLGAELATFNVKHYGILGGLKLIQFDFKTWRVADEHPRSRKVIYQMVFSTLDGPTQK